jgi:hypothetical protein
VPATPVKPSKPATTAKIRNVSVQLNMAESFFWLVQESWLTFATSTVVVARFMPPKIVCLVTLV